MRWVMQYRTRDSITSEWQEWKNLPKELTFSSYYHPMYFQFRVIANDAPAFSFFGQAVDEKSILGMD